MYFKNKAILVVSLGMNEVTAQPQQGLGRNQMNREVQMGNCAALRGHLSCFQLVVARSSQQNPDIHVLTQNFPMVKCWQPVRFKETLSGPNKASLGTKCSRRSLECPITGGQMPNHWQADGWHSSQGSTRKASSQYSLLGGKVPVFSFEHCTQTHRTPHSGEGARPKSSMWKPFTSFLLVSAFFTLQPRQLLGEGGGSGDPPPKLLVLAAIRAFT